MKRSPDKSYYELLFLNLEANGEVDLSSVALRHSSMAPTETVLPYGILINFLRKS